MPSNEEVRVEESRIFNLLICSVITVSLALLVTECEAVFRAILVIGLFGFRYLLQRLVLAVERFATES